MGREVGSVSARTRLSRGISLGTYHLLRIAERRVETCSVPGELGLDELEEKLRREFVAGGEMLLRVSGIVVGVFLRRGAYHLW